MKYRYHRKIAKWFFVLCFCLVLFLAVFFVRQTRLSKGQDGKSFGLKCEVVKNFTFSDDNAIKEWEEKVFKNKTSYKIEKSGDLSYVKASSDKAASALYYKVKIDAKSKRPVIKWKWRVDKFPAKTRAESLEMENEDDFAARVYVIFPAMFITNSKVLEYVWSETLPAGTTGTSPYSGNIKLMVLTQGVSKNNAWVSEERDIYSDYVKLFGKPPEYNIGAIAFMTNTEHTGTSAEAAYDDIVIGYKEEIGANKGGA